VVDGQRLRFLRRQHGLSQETLAYQAGISPATVARLERQFPGVVPGPHLAVWPSLSASRLPPLPRQQPSWRTLMRAMQTAEAGVPWAE